MLFIYILFSAISLILVVKGADLLVESGTAIAKRLHVPDLIIGATIISFGTTLPEFTVSVFSSVGGDVSLAVSNSIGSMLANMALIAGLSILIKPYSVERRAFIPKIIFFAFATFVLVLFTLTGSDVGKFEASILIALFVVFVLMNVFEAAKSTKTQKKLFENGMTENDTSTKKTMSCKGIVVFFFVGVCSLFLGSKVLVSCVSSIATDYLNISTAIVGVTVVAIGTSLPELVTSITSVKKGNFSLTLGNVIGANVINATLVTGMSFILSKDGSCLFDCTGALVFLVLASLVCIIPILIKQKTYRIQGAAMLMTYVCYLIYLFV